MVWRGWQCIGKLNGVCGWNCEQSLIIVENYLSSQKSGDLSNNSNEINYLL